MITEFLYYIFIFPLEQVLGWIFLMLFNITKSYGISIILLSLSVNLFLLKIFLYTDKKAADEAAIKEKLDKRIKAWKSVYKKAKLYAFTQRLYKQNNYHPIYALRGLGGLALQIPFFWAMYEIIKGASYLENAKFLWITDLSKPDSISLFNTDVHILPLLMTAFTLVNVFYSAKSNSAKVQGSLIALLFLVLLYEMPSALVLYWTCNMGFALLKEVWKAYRQNALQYTQSHIAESCDISTKEKNKESSILQKNLYKLIQYIIITSSFMICVSSPYALYVTDLHAFNLSTIMPTLAALFGFFMLISFTLLYAISIFKENTFSLYILWIIAWICLAALLLGVGYNFIFQGDYGPMSYFLFEKSIIVSKNDRLIDTIMITSSVILAFALLLLNAVKYIIPACKILLLLLVINALFSLATAFNNVFARESIENKLPNTASQNTHILDFAKEHNNILVLVLDRSDGYIAHEIFKENTHLKNSFKGFIDFTNALSTSGFTLPTMTSIIGGEHYTALHINARDITDGLPNEIARGYANTLNAFEKAGYATSSMLDFPVDSVHLYPLLHNTKTNIFDTTYLQNQYANKYLDGVQTDTIPIRQLISYGLFRSATHVARNSIYRRGMWLFNQKGIVDVKSLRAIAEIRALVEYPTTNATKPTFKFIHNSITHNPYGLDFSCNFNPKQITSVQDHIYGAPDGHYNSEKCAWQWVAQMLDRLQELGVYDNTEIFITADHGAQKKFLPIEYNLHIPLFYKPLQSKGEMKQDSRIITNYDIPSLFCKNLANGCPNINSITLDSIPHSRIIKSMKLDGGWMVENQNPNSFKLSKIYTFNGNSIYDKNAWKIQDIKEK